MVLAEDHVGIERESTAVSHGWKSVKQNETAVGIRQQCRSEIDEMKLPGTSLANSPREKEKEKASWPKLQYKSL